MSLLLKALTRVENRGPAVPIEVPAPPREPQKPAAAHESATEAELPAIEQFDPLPETIFPIEEPATPAAEAQTPLDFPPASQETIVDQLESLSAAIESAAEEKSEPPTHSWFSLPQSPIEPDVDSVPEVELSLDDSAPSPAFHQSFEDWISHVELSQPTQPPLPPQDEMRSTVEAEQLSPLEP